MKRNPTRKTSKTSKTNNIFPSLPFNPPSNLTCTLSSMCDENIQRKEGKIP